MTSTMYDIDDVGAFGARVHDNGLAAAFGGRQPIVMDFMKNVLSTLHKILYILHVYGILLYIVYIMIIIHVILYI